MSDGRCMHPLRLLRIDTFARYHDRIKKSRILTCFGVACPGSEDNLRGLSHESGVIYALIRGVSCDLALCKLLDFGFVNHTGGDSDGQTIWAAKSMS